MYMDDAVLAGIITVVASIAFIAGIGVFVWQDIKKKNAKHWSSSVALRCKFYLELSGCTPLTWDGILSVSETALFRANICPGQSESHGFLETSESDIDPNDPTIFGSAWVVPAGHLHHQ